MVPSGEDHPQDEPTAQQLANERLLNCFGERAFAARGHTVWWRQPYACALA